ncbi:DHS-like NAD/FAD-binding domain-containing protein [Naematelia encephala]|uniref:DHS-like NAD/FAD-binding domain-containing protein n=1 Tax=Naematelia encephala TaxID=71784 RepID=A0A1Y2AEI9_9TREE|nr:DHS-like NAD/FAD-binding domain-containing protein [Naematelia encephala]
MSDGSLLHEVTPGETYQLDSEEYDSDEERDLVDDDEYDHLVEEAENGFTEDEVLEMMADLKERGLITFLRSYLTPNEAGETASLRRLLLGFGIIPPGSLRDPSTPNVYLLPFAKIALSRVLRRRTKLPQYNTVDDAVELLRNAKKVIVLSGAGISTSCGIPDFRSSTGLYAQLQQEGKYELDDPQQMFDIQYFKEDPEVFYSFAKQIYPSNFTPSPCHRWIKLLEDRGVLLRNYTQNIDTLESLAGVTKVLQCHGSFKTASCLRCRTRVPGQTIEPYILSSQIPYCGICRTQRDAELEAIKVYKAQRRKEKGKGRATDWGSGNDTGESDEDEWGRGEPGIMKALDSEFDECLFHDREEVDLLVIIGTSLKVAPVSEVLTHIPHSVPQIFINLTPISHVHPDICLLGDADTIVTYLSSKLGWEIPPPAAVLHSPETARNQLEADQLPVRPKSSIKIAPEDVAWASGVGEVAHVQFLTSKQELASRDMVAREGSDPLDVKNGITETVALERQGYEADNEDGSERPAKRPKKEEVVEVL